MIFSGVSATHTKMSNRLSPTTHEMVYRFLTEKFGEMCWNCGARPCGNQKLDIDHIDDDKYNWQPANLQLACRSCNVRKQRHLEQRRKYPEFFGEGAPLYSPSEGESSSPTAKVRQTLGDVSRGGPVFHANALMEPTFRSHLLDRLNQENMIEWSDAIDDGAEASGCSTETARRYLNKMCSASGPLARTIATDGRTVVVRK